MAPKIILASASPARYKLLQSAGITPEVIVSGVDEESSDYQNLSPKELVIALAIVKAHTVRAKINYPALIIGCDSTFEFQGQSLGKPGSAENAVARAKQLRGKSGLLHTGHCIKGVHHSPPSSTLHPTGLRAASTELYAYAIVLVVSTIICCRICFVNVHLL